MIRGRSCGPSYARPKGNRMDEYARSRDGTPIAFDRSGDGPPVILVGGAFQHRLIDETAAQVQARLAWHFTVFHYDRRGRGDSGDTPPYAVEREVEDLAVLIDEAGGAAAVYGVSSGAALALEAAGHGVPISRLALYEPPFMVDPSRPQGPPDFVARLAELASSGRRGEAVEYFLTSGPGIAAEVVADTRSPRVWPALERVAHTLAYDIALMADQERLLAEVAPRVSVPTLLLDGGSSPPWAGAAVRALAGRLPNATRRTLAGQTHEVAPEALSPVLQEFFSGATGAAPDGYAAVSRA
jgi:pimeloyl-ACP methyl ester carboxylesterase